jgi:hypothetical protein
LLPSQRLVRTLLVVVPPERIETGLAVKKETAGRTLKSFGQAV